MPVPLTVCRLLPGAHGPDEGWALAYPECRERNQSPINILDHDAKASMEYQELTLEGFDAESSNKTSMKNTGKTGMTINTVELCIYTNDIYLLHTFTVHIHMQTRAVTTTTTYFGNTMHI